MKINIKEILFWILIATSIFFLLWRIFGNSPTGEIILYPLLIALIVKNWSVGEDTVILKTKLGHFEKQFSALAKDFKEHLNKNQ